MPDSMRGHPQDKTPGDSTPSTPGNSPSGAGAGKAAHGDAGRDSFHEDLIAALPRLRVQALALTRNRSAADDLVQDAVAKALAARASFEPGTNMQGWLHRILRNTFISDMRRRRPTVTIDDAPADALARSGGAEDRLLMGELSAALARLPADQREALVLLTVQNMSCEEIAAATGCAVGTVKARVFRARRALQTMLLGDESVSASDGLGRDRRAARAPKPACSPGARNDRWRAPHERVTSASGEERAMAPASAGVAAAVR
jgi:RNA polymerase sigma-70 factor (ECF subfamily)